MSELILTVEQKQNLSQKVIQNIEILQMSAQELDSYLNNVALENPKIEVEPDSAPKENTQIDVEYSREDYSESSRKPHTPPEDRSNSLEQIPANPINSLSEHILFQLIPYFHAEKDKSVFYYLVESLDCNGFLTITPSTLCDVFKLSIEDGQYYISTLRSVEPAGIGASDLSDCLLLQLNRSMHPCQNLASQIISEHLDKAANNQIKLLSKILNTSTADISAAISLIKTLNPRPANGFCCNDLATYIQPDVIILQKHNHF